MADGYQRLGVDGNWQRTYTLDSVPLKDGESMCVLWPAGEQSIIPLIVRIENQPYSDHGVPTSIPMMHASFLYQVNGAKVEIKIDENSQLKFKRDPAITFDRWHKFLQKESYSWINNELAKQPTSVFGAFSVWLLEHERKTTWVKEQLQKISKILANEEKEQAKEKNRR